MKRILKYLATVVVASAAFVGCIIDDPVAGPIVNPVDPNAPAPGTNPISAEITVDGDFADWDALGTTEYFISEIPADAKKTGGKIMKATYNKDYIYVYLELDAAAAVGVIDLYVDGDGAYEGGIPTTGWGGSSWLNCGADILLEGELTADGFDPAIYGYRGANMAGDWNWDVDHPLAAGGVVEGCAPKTLANGNQAVEIAIPRTSPGIDEKAPKASLGVILSDAGWAEVGQIPQGGVDNNGESIDVEVLVIDLQQHNDGQGGGNKPAPKPIRASITIDGSLSDWDALAANEYYSFVVPADAFYKAGKQLKVTYDADFIYAYVEYDGSAEANVGIVSLVIDGDGAYENGIPTTGWGGWYWENDGGDILAEGAVTETGYDPEIFNFTGVAMSGDWAWTSVASSGIISGSTAIDLGNGNKAVEIAIPMTTPGIDANAKQIRVGAKLTKGDWSDSNGYIPEVSADSEGKHVLTETLLVDLTKHNDVEAPAVPEGPISASITVDGNFADWEALTGYEYYYTALPAEYPMDSGRPVAREMKVTYDANNIYIYLEYLKNYAAKNGRQDKLDIWINTDGDATNGFCYSKFNDSGAEYAISGVGAADAEGLGGWDPALSAYAGAPGTSDYNFTEILPSGSGVAETSAHVDIEGDLGAVEIKISRAMIPGLGNEFSFGIWIVNSEQQSTSGLLPHSWDNGEANAPFMTVKLDAHNADAVVDVPSTPDTPVTPPATAGTLAVDGDHSEWAGITEANGAVAVMPEGASSVGLKEIKFAADEVAIYGYVKYDVSCAHFGVFLDLDNNNTTGNASYLFGGAGGMDLLVLGDPNDYSWADVLMHAGTAGANEWNWGIDLTSPGIVTGSTPVDLGDGTKAVEFSIMHVALSSFISGKQIGVGAYSADGAWTDNGLLPQGAPAEGKTTYTTPMVVTLP